MCFGRFLGFSLFAAAVFCFSIRCGSICDWVGGEDLGGAGGREIQPENSLKFFSKINFF